MARARRRKRHFLSNVTLPRLGRRDALRIGGTAIAAVLVAYGAGALALVNVARANNPGLSVRLGDPEAKLAAIQQDATREPGRLLSKDVEDLAKRALTRDGLSSPALRLLALRATGLRDAKNATILAGLAERVSRRDLPTQFLLIEQAVQADDYKLALRHYDVALRTKADARAILFPVLSAALDDAALRLAVVPFVQARANWVRDFVEFTVRDGADGPRRIGTLLVQARGGGQSDLMATSGATVIGMLTDQHQFGLAEQLYLQMAGASPAMLEDVSFNKATTDPRFGTFAWATHGGTATDASFEGLGEKERQLRAFAGSNERGVVVRRVLRLKPGAYKFSESRSVVVDSSGASASWEMKCAQATPPATLWKGPTEKLGYEVVQAPGPIVPANCPNQIIELTVAGGDGQQGMEVLISRLHFSR